MRLVEIIAAPPQSIPLSGQGLVAIYPRVNEKQPAVLGIGRPPECAEELDMAGVVVPPHAGVFSALGLLLSPSRVDVSRSALYGDEDVARLARDVKALIATAIDDFAAMDAAATPDIEIKLDARYLGQSHEISGDYGVGTGWDVLAGDFHRLHERRYGFSRFGEAIEVRASFVARRFA